MKGSMENVAVNSDPPAYLEMRFKPNVVLITVVRRFVSSFYQEVLGNRDAVSRLAVATHELLENAVKYSSNGETTISISVDRSGDERFVEIVTRNRADENNLS